jgi:aminoglycoside phosphotransferase (APT) family kinase protein
VDLLAAFVPSLAAHVRRVGQVIAHALVTTPAGGPCLNHGSFKPSQLVFCEPDRVVVTDLDHCCLADPALDLGYFLAYLRPAALWRGRGVARVWYETEAGRFSGAYTAAASAKGASQGAASALARARLYEAAVMFKIAMRRLHRLNSPRPHELEAIVTEALSRANSAAEGAW